MTWASLAATRKGGGLEKDFPEDDNHRNGLHGVGREVNTYSG